jgi:hypothetical protein
MFTRNFINTLKKNKTLYFSIFKILFLAAFIAFVFFKMDYQLILNTCKKIGMPIFFACIALEMLFYALDSTKIWLFMEKKMSFSILMKSKLVALLGGNFLPGIVSGDVLRVVLVCGGSLNKVKTLAVALVASRVYSFCGLSVLVVVYFLGRYYIYSFLEVFLFLALGACFISIPLCWQFRFFKKRIFALTHFLRVSRKNFKTFNRTLNSYSSFSYWSKGTSLSMFSNFICVFQFYLISMKVIPEMAFLDWCIQVPIIALSTFLPIGFGAVGSQDFAMVSLASINQINVESMLGVSIVMHAARFVVSLFGLIYLNSNFNSSLGGR